ncbi:MAG: uroporphyrinogen decarboxylase/cobalamine-independent methonine synthase family protein, partial [Planctomycetota bacterium]
MSEAEEKSLVRDLARRVAEIAASDGMEAIRRRWRDVNALRKPDRAPVWCRPVGAWDEILPDSSLKCADPWLRGLERGFRRALVKHEIGDDSPLEKRFTVSAVVRAEPANLWGVDVGKHSARKDGGAWGYDPPLKEPADFDKLRMPSFALDEAASRERLERTRDLLGGIAPVELTCSPPLGATLGTAAAELRGLEQMMMDMALQPELTRRLMGHVRDAALAGMDAAEGSGLLSPNNSGPMVESDSLGPRPEDGRFTLANRWCMANSQEFDQVSPEMWEEFCLAYQKPLFARYGLVAYGCCENLTRKIDGVLSIPNLRVFVCSAWTDLDAVLEKVGADYCIMWRQKASDVVFPDDEAQVAR